MKSTIKIVNITFKIKNNFAVFFCDAFSGTAPFAGVRACIKYDQNCQSSFEIFLEFFSSIFQNFADQDVEDITKPLIALRFKGIHFEIEDGLVG